MPAQNHNHTITATDLYRFFQCPHWPYWERFGDAALKREQSQEEIERNQQGIAHERETIERLFPDVKAVASQVGMTAVEQTLECMRQGVKVIYQGTLVDEDRDWLGRPDLLERHEGKSLLGDWYYVPVEIKSAHEVRKDHKAQLVFYAHLLEKVQGILPSELAVINGYQQRFSFLTESFEADFWEIISELDRIRDGVCPDPVYRKACVDTSPWGTACFALAKEQDDIALLYNVDIKRLKLLRSLGIRTVEDAAEIDPEQLGGTTPGLTVRLLQHVQRQARSLKEQLVIVRKPFVHETKGAEIHFDIESHPPSDVDYLFGFWMGSYADGSYKAFVAKRVEDEKTLWQDFLAWLPTLPAEYTVYHYAHYEVQRLQILAERYGSTENAWLQLFVSRMVDLKSLVPEHIVLPLYFYSLKAIGKFLGFSWKGAVQGGGASVTAFEEWVKTQDETILQSIIQYNTEDVQATAFLLDWFRRYSAKEGVFAPPYPWKADNDTVLG